jgi:hypothetical protein
MNDMLRGHLDRRFGRSRWRVAGQHSGLSGTAILRVESMDELFAVRSWSDPNSAMERVAMWHEASLALNQFFPQLSQLFLHNPIPPPLPWSADPSHERLVWDGQQAWTLSPWKAGEPLSDSKVELQPKLVWADQLAALHMGLKDSFAVTGPSQGFAERLAGVQNLAPHLSDSLSFLGPRFEAYCRFVSFHRERWIQELSGLCQLTFRQHWILRDLWRDNLLVNAEGDWLHSVDIGASRVEWPVFDFLRLFGSLKCSVEEWKAVWQVYQSHQKSDASLSFYMLLTIHTISTALSIDHWLRRWQGGMISIANQPKSLGRLLELFDEFELATS